jgi:hypothetical protein
MVAHALSLGLTFVTNNSKTGVQCVRPQYPAVPWEIGRRDRPRRAAAERLDSTASANPQRTEGEGALPSGPDTRIRDRLRHAAEIAVPHGPAYLGAEL